MRRRFGWDVVKNIKRAGKGDLTCCLAYSNEIMEHAQKMGGNSCHTNKSDRQGDLTCFQASSNEIIKLTQKVRDKFCHTIKAGRK